MTIVLDHKKLLGFRILAPTVGGKAGVKTGAKPGQKAGAKLGVKSLKLG